MNYEEAINYVESTTKFGMKFGLERTEKILELLGNPHKKIKCIHVAGTNGKGSITAMTNAILIEAGYKVGMYTSPYIEEFEERIQVNNVNISKEDFASIITEIKAIINKIIEEEYGNPTYFEIITCAAFLYYYRQKVDFAVIEVGLGGRLDSTNVINPILSIISSISLDHMDILGNTLEKIAFEKAGIIKEGVPVILYPQEEESERIIEKICKEKNSNLIKVNKNSVQFLGLLNEAEENFKDETNDESYKRNFYFKNKKPMQRLKICTEKQNYNLNLSLLGRYQLLNCATVIYAVEELINLGLNIKTEHVIKALCNVAWKGRLEVLKSDPLVVIDGAHNIGGTKSLKESINTYFSYNKLILILGILADKQVHEMVQTIVPLGSKIITVTPHSERGKLSEDLKNIVEQYNPECEAVEDYNEAYKKALGYYEQGDMLLICGSLYMIGDMRKIITK